MCRRWGSLLLAFALACLPLAMAEEEGGAAVALSFLARMEAGEYEAAVSSFSAEMSAALSAEDAAELWRSLQAQLGAYRGASSVETQETENGTVVIVHSAFEAMGAAWTVVVQGEEIVGLWVKPEALPAKTPPPEAEQAPPAGVRSERILLRAGSETETHGTLLLPAGEGPFPVVILIHGSGASDENETIYGNQPFRDLAEGLAARGVASVRYDKFPYAHADLFEDAAYAARFTVRQEYEEDLLAALTLTEADARLGETYLVGHSLGAMLLPRLMQACDGRVVGGVSLAGSPRQLWQISRSQNLALLPSLEGEAQAAARAQIERGTEKAERLSEMTDEEAKNETVFGMSAFYAREIAAYDAVAIAKELALPLLFLQGEADFQVSMADDFEAWRTALAGETFASFISYPRLNHLFMDTGDVTADSFNYREVYQIPARVDSKVVEDIAAFILRQSR